MKIEDALPVGTVHMFVDGRQPDGWFKSDGRRLRRREDPPLYDLLWPLYHRRWRRWVVHLPRFGGARTILSDHPRITFDYFIKGSRA